jgi:hypothetical protein
VKNITVSVPDEVYRAARIAAAGQDTSVSALVASYLRSFTTSDEEFERLRRREQEIIAGIDAHFSMKDNVSRDALHDRAALREDSERAKRALR